MLHAVILAGGRGERFWPLSRRDRPKQLLPLIHGRTLLEETLDRLAGVVEPARVLVVTSQTLVASVSSALERHRAAAVYGEPAGRNTAPAVTYAAVRVRRTDPDAVCVVLPSDHIVEPIAAFSADLERAVRLAEDGLLVTFGIPPTRPETGYGYLEAGAPIEGVTSAARVRAFREKPDAATAAAYLASGQHLWNSGMFVWRADALLRAVGDAMPALAALARQLAAEWVEPDGGEAADRFYREAEAVSVDYGVMERVANIALVHASFAWDDVGSWAAMSRIAPPDADGNVALGTVIARDTRDSILVSDGGLVAALGVEGLVIVRAGEITMVAPVDRAEEVRSLVEALRAHGLSEYE